MKVCRSIAQKHSQSVDFPKTGQPPQPLVKIWSKIETDDGIKYVPPERAQRFPDFMCKYHEPSYVSPRLVGDIFRLFIFYALIFHVLAFIVDRRCVG